MILIFPPRSRFFVGHPDFLFQLSGRSVLWLTHWVYNCSVGTVEKKRFESNLMQNCPNNFFFFFIFFELKILLVKLQKKKKKQYFYILCKGFKPSIKLLDLEIFMFLCGTQATMIFCETFPLDLDFS